MNTEQTNEVTDRNAVSQENGNIVTTQEPIVPQEGADLVVPSGVETQMAAQVEEHVNNSTPVETASATAEPVQEASGTGTPENDPLGLNDGRYTADEITEQPEIIKVIDKKPRNKKIIIIVVIVVLLLAIAGGVAFFVLNKPKKKQSSVVQEKVISNDSQFVKAIKSSLKNESFDKEIKKGLVENNINSETVFLLNLDIDSDNEQEILVFAEENEKKVILQLEVDEEVLYDDSYPVDAKDSLGYVYSPEKTETFWYTEHTKNYTIIGSTKKIIKEEDFVANYYALTKTYQNQPVIAGAIEYKFDKKLDASQLEKKAITNEDLLVDNKIEKDNIKEMYDKYLKEKEEAEKKKKEEEEAKAKQEEETRKLSGSLKIGDSSYRFGTYNVYTSDGSLDGTLILYGDLTCVHKGITCTYTVGEVRGANDTLVPGISLSTGQIYVTSTKEGTLTNAEETVSIEYTS